MKKKTSRRGSDALRREYDFSELGAPAIGKYHRRSKGAPMVVVLAPDGGRGSAGSSAPVKTVKKAAKSKRPTRGKH